MGCCSSAHIVKGNDSNLQEARITDFTEHSTSFIQIDEKQRAFTFNNQFYIEQNKIGSGSFADVYLYKNSSDGSLHALKIFKDNTTSQAFLQEYQIMKDVESKFIIRIEELMKIDDKLCIMIEYANQGTLGSFMQSVQHQTVSINANQILDIVCDIFSGLDIIHAKKIIHRDLKMDNLLVSNYQIKIADLGVATYLISKSYAQTNIGNMLYAAPEKLNEKENYNYNSASDIFSAGLIVLQMILGLSSIEVLKLKMNKNYTNQIQESPESLRNFIELLLNENPSERPTANNAYNIGRKLKYDQNVLDYINIQINGMNPQLFSKENKQVSLPIPSGQSLSALQSTAMTSINTASASTEEQLFEQGIQYYFNTEYEKGEQCFSKILERNPVSVLALIGRLLCGERLTWWVNKKQYTEQWVQDQLKLIEQLNPNHYIYYFCKSVINEDIDSINKCLELNPSMPEALARKGSLLKSENKIEEAIKVGQQALEMNENSAYVLRILGFIYEKINKDISDRFYYRSLEICPNQYVVLYNLGINSKNNNNIDKALEYLDQSLSICPYFRYSIKEKLIIKNKNQHKEIIDQIQKLFKEYGDLPFFYSQLGYSYKELGDNSKSLYYYIKSLLYEESDIAFNNIAIIYDDQKEYEKAQEYYQKAIDRKHKLSFINMFKLLAYDLNQDEKAKEFLNQLLELDFDMNNEDDCMAKIEALRLLEQYKEFFAFSEMALKKHPSSQEVSHEVLKQISLDDFKEDLLTQFKLSEMIQNNQGVRVESTKCILKYLSLNKMNDLVVSHILKYIEDTILKQGEDLYYYYTLVQSFEQYVNQDIFQNMYDGLKQLQQGNPSCLEYQIVFISLINFKQLEISNTMKREFEKVEIKVDNLFKNEDDQELITYLRFYYQKLKINYYIEKDNVEDYVKAFEETKKIRKKVNISFKKRFKDYFKTFLEILDNYLELKNVLKLDEKTVDFHKELKQKVINEGISLFPDLAEELK